MQKVSRKQILSQSHGTKKGLRPEKITWPNNRPKAWQQWNFKPRKSPLISVLSPVADEFLLKGWYCHTCYGLPTLKTFFKDPYFNISVNNLTSKVRLFKVYIIVFIFFVLFYTWSHYVPQASSKLTIFTL